MPTLDLLGDWHRTGYAGDLRAADAEKDVVLMGWVHRRRANRRRNECDASLEVDQALAS